MNFLGEDGNFDVASFRHAVEIVFTAQEIVVGSRTTPRQEIGANARAVPSARSRYANLAPC